MEDYSRQDLLNEIRNLREMREADDELHAKKSKEIHMLRDWRRTLLDAIIKKNSEINNLREAAAELGGVISEKNSEIKRLEADLASIEDYSDKQAEVIKHYFNQIKGLVNGQR